MPLTPDSTTQAEEEKRVRELEKLENAAVDAIKEAQRISRSPWPIFWTYKQESKEDAVWKILQPVRDYLYNQTGKSMEREVGATYPKLIAAAELAIGDVSACSAPSVPKPTL